MQESIQRRNCFENDVSTSTAVTAVWPAFGDKFLAAKAQAAVPSLACLDPEFCGIDKHRRGTTGAGWPELLGGLYTDESAVPCLSFKLDCSTGLRKQGMVISQPDIVTGMENSPSLADQDFAGINELPGKPFHAQAASGTIAPIR
jgi:hypothetical protein